MILNNIYNQGCLEGLQSIDSDSIDCCVTSPPYWGLRDYGHSDQIGLEKTPDEYVSRIIDVFREVKRVLKPEGTLWLNLGDSYCSTAGGTMGDSLRQEGILAGVSDERAEASKKFRPKVPTGLKPKDLVGIPWMVAFALRADGWYLRQDIIWHKPNPMPESVTDRCTKSHEYIFLMSKSSKYYYDHEAIKTECKDPLDDLRRIEAQTWDNKNTPDNLRNGIRPKTKSTFGNRDGELNGLHSGKPYYALEKANKRSVWTVNTMPYKDAHFATFPEELIVDCIKAGCPENGIVLDPFMGAGTTALVARKLNRNFIGFELNPDYLKIANNRLERTLGMFA